MHLFHVFNIKKEEEFVSVLGDNIASLTDVVDTKLFVSSRRPPPPLLCQGVGVGGMRARAGMGACVCVRACVYVCVFVRA